MIKYLPKMLDIFTIKDPRSFFNNGIIDRLKNKGAMTLVLKVDSICSTLTKLYLVALGATPALFMRQVMLPKSF